MASRPRPFGQLRDRVKLALDAMQKRNDPPTLFSRSSIMARMPDDTYELQELDAKAVLAELAEVADWVKHDRKGNVVDADPPANVISAILGARRLPFPPIDSVAPRTVFHPRGQVSSTIWLSRGCASLPCTRCDAR